MLVPDPIANKVRRYYQQTLHAHGPTPRGVDWKSAESQQLRFVQLVKVFDPPVAGCVNDLGCGYGALAHYLAARGLAAVYHGYDLCAEMIDEARRLVPSGLHCEFSSDPAEFTEADYTLSSGIFNVRLDIKDDDWRTYMADTVVRMFELSRRGIAFNVLSAAWGPRPGRPDLYFADPHYWFDFCRRLSPHVALLHDYPLHEFTFMVRR